GLNIDLNKIMSYIDTLTNKHFIRVEVLKNDKGLREEVVILDDFYNKISLMSISKDESKNKKSNIYEIIEKEFGRTLSPIEYEIIKAWLDNGFKESLIKEAIKEATFNGVSNLRYIDKILYEWNKKGIKTAKDVETNRKKRKNSKKDNKSDVDLELVDWNWFDEDE
ncbi:MAG: DnaD domain protein, partial [Bacilli bacterium]|nr:DnaD domain protein [Bacilli bacterium]